jgi:KDO2-lipid IV(A) lauroyltransferase
VKLRIEFFLARLVLFTLRRSPRRLALSLGTFYARLLDLLIPRLRRTALRNLELTGFPAPQHKPIVDGVFSSIGRLLALFARFPDLNRQNISDWIRYEGFEHFERARARGKGVLFATAHLGNWELSAFAHALLAEPLNIVVRPLDNPFIDSLVERRRTCSGNRLIDKTDAARSILRALRNGEAVGVLIDQNSAASEGVFVDFFGVKACANLAFARIAAHSGAAVVPGFALWDAHLGRYTLRFLPEVEISGDSSSDTQRLQTILENVIRQCPDQWLWIHRRWKTRPSGEAPLY